MIVLQTNTIKIQVGDLFGTPTGHETKGTVYDIYAESGDGRVLFLVGRLFPDGTLYIISARWAKNNEEIYYYKAREVLFNE